MNKSGKVNNSSRVKESLSERPGRSKIRHPSGTYNPGVDIRYLGVRGDGGGGRGEFSSSFLPKLWLCSGTPPCDQDTSFSRPLYSGPQKSSAKSIQNFELRSSFNFVNMAMHFLSSTEGRQHRSATRKIQLFNFVSVIYRLC